MATYVLVHGAWHGAWCWQKLTPLLEERGHRVAAVDLPGHGDDATPVAGMTLQANAETVRDAIESAGEPVILVGHSMGGMSITQAAELVPERIARLVYVTAFLPNDGQSLPDLGAALPGSDNVQPQLVVDADAGTTRIDPNGAPGLFYGECSDADAAWATSQLVPESIAAIAAPVQISEERAGSAPRAYVECTRDAALTHELQRHMQAARPCDPVFELDADHSPFLSRPRELADALLSLA